jgi:uncharacterized protein
MTPQERELITKLFERLTPLETAQRDPDAERAIAEGLARAPHAIYPLVQTVLVQDEALKAANAKIEELEAALSEPPPEPERPKGFLDNMREGLFGRGESQPHAGSVPSVPQQGGSPWANAPGYRDQGFRDQGYRDQPPPGMGGPGYGGAPGYGGPGYGGAPGYGGGPGGGGGSFLGTAAASAAGMIGGSLLLGGIRNMLGGHGTRGGPFAGAFDHLSSGSSGGSGAAPWSGGGGSGDLGRRAGLDDIGRPPGGSGSESTRTGLFGGSDDQGDDQDGGDDEDGDSDDGDSDDGGGSDDSSDS